MLQKITTKKLLLGLVGGLLIVAIAYGGYALLKQEPNGGTKVTWETYRNDKYGFSFEYPESWKFTGLSTLPSDSLSEKPQGGSIYLNQNSVQLTVYTDLSNSDSISNPNSIIGGKKGNVEKRDLTYNAKTQHKNTRVYFQYTKRSDIPKDLADDGFLVFIHVLETFKFDDLKHSVDLPNFSSL